MLDSSRLQQAETIFHALVGMPPERRLPVLAERCGGDAELNALVQRLLKYDEGGRGFLGGGGAPAEESARIPEAIGHFQVVRRISEGGMGVVYEARQANPRRSVAIKVIRGGRFVDRYSVKLFQREAQALARLRHPGIAAIYEAGQTDDGQHFFAMEYIEGRPLLDHVRAAGLSERQKLDMFARICDAIHYAHQRGVMHRDLKPSNILIDADGRPRILDFGLARITDAELGVDGLQAISLPRTAAGRIQGTLKYMSPEQARGDADAIDTRSDVYALGVILYELLTERPPYDVAGLPLPKAVEIICNQPPRASDRLRGDLETIARKAMEKDPQHRYPSAAAFAEDVRRYLTSQPILARPPGAAYLLRKLVVRHKWPSAFAATVLILLVGFGVWMTALYRAQWRESQRAEAEARRANEEAAKSIAERDKTETFARFMSQTLAGVGPSVARGRDTRMLKEMMDVAAKRIDDGELETSPAAELRLRESIGRAYREIAEFSSAEKMVVPALALAERSSGRESAEYASAVRAHASLLFEQSRYAEALPKYEESLAITERLVPANEADMAIGLSDLGACLQVMGRTEDAVARFESALSIWQRLSPGDRADTATTLNNLADCHQMLGRLDKALEGFQAALSMGQRLFPDDHPSVAMYLNNVGHCLHMQGRWADALPKCESALAMDRRLHPGDHPSTAVSLINLGKCLISLGRPGDALPKLEESSEMLGRLFPGDHPNKGTALNYVANCLDSLGRREDALHEYEAALAIWQRMFTGDHPQMAAGLNNVANCLTALGRPDEALPKFEASVGIWRRLSKGDHPQLVIVLNNLGHCLGASGRPEEALHTYDEALAMGKRTLPAGHTAVLTSEVGRGAVLVELGRLDEAEPLLRAALEVLPGKPGAAAKPRQRALESIVKLYDARHAADPDGGHAQRAADWRARLAELQATTRPAATQPANMAAS